MNGCRYCVIMHHRQRRGKRRARGAAMCLAQADLIRCDKKWYERGSGCDFHDHKAAAADQQQAKLSSVSAKSGDFPSSQAVSRKCENLQPTPMSLYTFG